MPPFPRPRAGMPNTINPFSLYPSNSSIRDYLDNPILTGSVCRSPSAMPTAYSSAQKAAIAQFASFTNAKDTVAAKVGHPLSSCLRV